MKTKKLEGGIEWPVTAVILVFIGMFVLAMTMGFYLRSALVGKPIKVKTYTEYRWMNYFPSSILFYLSYPSDSWKALNELVKLDFKKIKPLKIEQIYAEHPEITGLIKLKELLENLEEKTKKKDNTYIIKDQKGLIISMGLPKNKLEGPLITFPEEYPYNCFYKDMPIFSKETKNMRIRFVVCCYDIKECSNYLTGPGRGECSSNDPCGVGPCKLVICKENSNLEECKMVKRGTRLCLKNELPKINFTAKFDGTSKWTKERIEKEFKGDTKVNFKLEVEKEFEISNITEIILDFGDSKKTFFIKKNPIDLKIEKWDSKSAIFKFNHTYKKYGDYTVTCVVRDEDGNENKKEDGKVIVVLAKD